MDQRRSQAAAVQKAATGIAGLDAITRGGLPRGRATLVAGAAGTGKSMLGIEFVARGARDHDEPGVLLTFEESADAMVANATAIGLDLGALVDDGRLVIDSAVGDADDLAQSGAFDLEGLRLRLGAAIERVGARRVFLDTVDVLLSALPDAPAVRRELARLLRWLTSLDVAVVLTAEPGRGSLTRHGVEDFVSDCVIVLDHRVAEEVATRRLRVSKYRGAEHDTNEFPFLITGSGFRVMPIGHGVEPESTSEQISLGVPRLDAMMGGGVYRGSTTMVSGSAGTGKTTIAAAAALAACERGERALFVSMEETASQIVRNMRSVGIDLAPHVESGLLHVRRMRPAAMGLEEHLAALYLLLDDLRPDVVVLDALGSVTRGVTGNAAASLVARDIDLMRTRGVTTVVTALAEDDGRLESTEISASSLVDAWLLLRNVESDGERNRLLYIIKNRGASHSNQVREFLLTDHGPELVDVFVGPDGVLTGSRRLEQADRDERVRLRRRADATRQRQHLDVRRAEVEAQVQSLRRALELEEEEAARLEALADDAAASSLDERTEASRRRSGQGT